MTPRPGGTRLIDGRPLVGHSGVRGIGTYLRELLLAFDRLGEASRITLVGDRGVLRHRGTTEGDATARAVGARVGPRLPILKRRLQPLADPFLVSVALRRARPSLYHAVEWAQPIAAGGVPVVLTVHDLIPFLFPRLYPWIRRERLLALRLVRRADAVVVPSRATGRDVERLAHVDQARIHVIPHGVSPDYAPAAQADVAALRARLGLGDRPHLLSVGTLDERKRRDALAETVARVRRDADVGLVIAGDQGVYAPLVDAALDREGIRSCTVLAGHVGTADLVALYSGAAVLVFPTAYEGFGLPVLEALACGTRVACFDNSALPEVASGVAAVVPDGDTAALAGAVAGILSEHAATRGERVAAGRAHAAAYTWERSARAHLAVYDAVETSRPPVRRARA